MPLSADPNARAEFALEIDADKPKSTRPVFFVRFMEPPACDKHAELLEEAYRCPPTGEGNRRCFELCWEILQLGITGWRNLVDKDGKPCPFTPEGLIAARLTDRELWELVSRYPSVARPSIADYRFFASPSPMASDSSAPRTAAADASPQTSTRNSATIAPTASMAAAGIAITAQSDSPPAPSAASPAPSGR